MVLFPGNLEVAPECFIDHEECRLEFRVILGYLKAEWFVWPIRAPAIIHGLGNAALLNVDISKRLRAEIGDIS